MAARAVEIRPAPPVAPPKQQEPQAAPEVVAEVLVTATKRVQSADRLAVAISVIPGEQLRATGAVDPGGTVGQVAGILTTNLGPGRDKLLLRGLSDGAFTGRARSTVGTYLDDTPINYNAPDPDLRLVDVEQVEVIRGPQGALYGAGSLSGVYRIVTRKPDLEDASAALQVMAATTQDGGPSRAIDGYANLPIIRNKIAARLAAYHEVEGGYLDDIKLGRSNVDRTTRDGARLSVAAHPNDTWTVNLAGAFQHLKSDDTHYTSPGLKRRRTAQVAEPHNNNIALAGATIRGTWSWGELVWSTGYVRHDYSSIYDATAVKDVYATGADIAIYDDSTRAKMLVQDLVLTSRGYRRLDWLVGLYGSITTENSSPAIRAKPNDGDLTTVYQNLQKDQIEEIAGYGEASYEVTPVWTVGLGARVFRSRSKIDSDVTSQRFAPRKLTRSVSFSGVSPKISLQGDIGGGDQIYAVASAGYRAGGINSGGALPLPAARETFGKDRLAHYEVGAKLKFLDRRLSLHSAIYYDDWTNIQADQFRASGLPYVANVGDARIAGLETEIALTTDAGLSLKANALVARTKITRANPAFATTITRGLPSTPDISGGVLATYERRLSENVVWRLTGQASYVGRSQVTFNPDLSPKMGGYWRIKMSAGLAAGRWAAQVFITNPGNALGDTFAFGNPFSFSQSRQITPQRPRTVGLELSAAM